MPDNIVRTQDKLHVATGDADIDVSAADYTSYQALITIAPAGNTAMYDVRLILDLDKVTTGWATAATTQTLQLAVARKVDGTNWRKDKITETTAIAGNNADAFSKEFDIGVVGDSEQVRIEVILSAEPAGDTEMPYLLYYRGREATITAVSA